MVKESSLKQLCDQQIRFAPSDQKLQQVAAAERLIGEVDPNKTYTYEYVCFRITGYRPESFARTAISGEQLLHDLHLFVEDLSDATDQQARTRYDWLFKNDASNAVIYSMEQRGNRTVAAIIASLRR